MERRLAVQASLGVQYLIPRRYFLALSTATPACCPVPSSLPTCLCFPSDGHDFPLHAGAEVLVRLHAERLALVRARLLRNPLFSPPLLSSVRKQYVPLTPVERVPHATDDARERLGAAAEDVAAAASSSLTLLGTLTQPSEGLWALEDEAGLALVLDLSCLPRNLMGMYTETAIVLVQGDYYADAVVLQSMAGSIDGVHHSSNSAGSGGRAAAASAATSLSTAGGRGAGGGSGTSFAAAVAGTAENRLPGSFRVRGLAQPPAEERSATLHAMGVADPLMVSATPGDVARERLVLRGSEEARNTMFVVASNVHLDSPHVMAALRRVLAGFAAAPVIPALFILMGNFTSRPFGERGGGGGGGQGYDRAAFVGYFDGLATLLAGYPEVTSRTRFVLIPGPRDPGSASGLLPRPPVPSAFCRRLLDPSVVPNVTLGTNPCRVRFLGQELVLFRGEVTTPLQRRSVMPLNPPPPEKAATEHMIRTVIDQAHLCPLPLSVRPLYWAYDHALRLSPTPDVLVMAEEGVEPYVSDYNGCCVFNPGSFGKSQFAVFSPVGALGLPSAEISRV